MLFMPDTDAGMDLAMRLLPRRKRMRLAALLISGGSGPERSLNRSSSLVRLRSRKRPSGMTLVRWVCERSSA